MTCRPLSAEPWAPFWAAGRELVETGNPRPPAASGEPCLCSRPRDSHSGSVCSGPGRQRFPGDHTERGSAEDSNLGENTALPRLRLYRRLRRAWSASLEVLVIMQTVLDVTLGLTYLMSSPGESDTHDSQGCTLCKAVLEGMVTNPHGPEDHPGSFSRHSPPGPTPQTTGLHPQADQLVKLGPSILFQKFPKCFLSGTQVWERTW